MIGGFRKVLKRQQREADPLVKVAGVPSRRDAEACLEARERKGSGAEMRENGQRLGPFELWVRASQEPAARLVMGLSGRSVIRLERPRGTGEGRGRGR